MPSSNGNIFRVTGPLWGESTGYRWVLLTKASVTELWFFFDPYLNVNHLDAGDLRRRRAHYDGTIMKVYWHKPNHFLLWYKNHLHQLFFWHIEDAYRINESLNWIIIDSNSGILPVRRQSIAWSNAE